MSESIATRLNQYRKQAFLSINIAVILIILSIGGFIIGYRQVKAPFLIVLNFHGVVAKPSRPWEITQTKLEAILDSLEKHDFKPVSPEEFESMFELKNFSSGRHYLVTFDDGLESSVPAIKQLFSKRGIKSAFFIVTDLVGTENYTDYATLKDLKNNFSCKIGLHGKRHYEVTKILNEGTDLLSELEQARQILASNTESGINWYAYPYGEYNQEAVSVIASTSMQYAFTVDGYEVDDKTQAQIVPRIMYLEKGKEGNAPYPLQYAPPQEERTGSLTITLSILVFMIGFSWIIRARRLLTAQKQIKKQSSL